MGRLGEEIAATFLVSRGLSIVDRNVVVDGGEIDLLARDGAERVAVEVRATVGSIDPIDAIDPAKRRKVRQLAGRLGAGRVDMVGVKLSSQACEIHWVPAGF